MKGIVINPRRTGPLTLLLSRPRPQGDARSPMQDIQDAVQFGGGLWPVRWAINRDAQVSILYGNSGSVVIVTRGSAGGMRIIPPTRVNKVSRLRAPAKKCPLLLGRLSSHLPLWISFIYIVYIFFLFGSTNKMIKILCPRRGEKTSPLSVFITCRIVGDLKIKRILSNTYCVSCHQIIYINSQ